MLVGNKQLLPHHLKDLRKSGLTDETIAAAGIYSETDYDNLKVILGCTYRPKKLAPALVFPYLDQGGQPSGYQVIKPDRPRIKADKPIKYEAPQGRPSRIYIPPRTHGVLNDPSCELIITEGQKKSLCADQHGFPCVGLAGVWNFKDGKAERLLPDFDLIAWRDRKVRICFDSDEADNPDIREAIARFAALLRLQGARPEVVHLPEGPPDESGRPTKQGLDDYLVRHGPAAVRQLLDAAETPEAPSPTIKKEKGKTADPAIEAERFLATTEFDGLYRLRYWRGTFWNWMDGRYTEAPTFEVKALLTRYLNERFFEVTARVTSDVLEQVKAQALLRGATSPPQWIGKPLMLVEDEYLEERDLLVAHNGLIHLPSLVAGKKHMLPCTPLMFCLNALDYDFEEEAERPEAWLRFLRELWPTDPDSIETLQEWFGLCLVPDTSHQKILGMFGPKRSGKGTICRVLSGLVGRANVAGPTFSSLATNFGLSALLNKSLAIISDARLSSRVDQAVVVERLLSISGEDALTVDRKYLEPMTVQLPTRLMIVSNELPRLNESSGALVGRMIILRLTESFYGNEDRTLTGKLLKERPGILLWAIQGWQRLVDRGYFIQPDSGYELASELEELSSPVGTFVGECCEIGAQYRTELRGLFTAWRTWCDRCGRKEPGTEQGFGRDLLAAVPALRRRKLRNGDTRSRAYDGIRLKGAD